MKYSLAAIFTLITFSVFSQTRNVSLIKGAITSFETNNLKKIENFAKANNFHFKDKSSEDDKNFITAYVKDATGEMITVNVKEGKVAILTYSLQDQQDYGRSKDEMSALGFDSNKPNENLAKGIVEEVNYQRNKMKVIASNIKSKSNSAPLYSFTIVSSF